MYNNFNFNTSRPHGALEIEQHAKELEKRYALMKYLNRNEQRSGVAEAIGKAARRIGSVIGSLFM